MIGEGDALRTQTPLISSGRGGVAISPVSGGGLETVYQKEKNSEQVKEEEGRGTIGRRRRGSCGRLASLSDIYRRGSSFSAQSYFCCSALVLSHIIILSHFLLEFSLRGGSCAGLPLFWRISVCLFGSKGTLLSDECDAIEPVCRVSLSEIKGVCTFAKLELIKTHKSK